MMRTRIAHICADPGVPVFGRKGCSIHVQEVIRAMRAAGAVVELFAARTEGPAPADLEDVALHLLPQVPKGNPAERERAALGANADLRTALGRAGQFDLVYERYSLWSFASMEYALQHDTPGVLEVNAPLIEEQQRYRQLIDRPAAERVATRAFGTASAIVAVSQEVARYVESFPGTIGRVHVVANGVDPNRFSDQSEPSLPAPDGICTVGFVGALKPWHGLETLIDAFARLHAIRPATRLLLVGDGPERETVAKALRSHDVQHVAKMTGAVRPEDVPGLLASMDVAVAPYPARDDFYFSPLKLYEYMAAGRAVVASHIGQIPEVIQDGLNGLLCPPGDAGSFAAACDRLCGDPGLRHRLGQSARWTALQQHSWEAVVQRIFSLAGELVPTGRLVEAGA